MTTSTDPQDSPHGRAMVMSGGGAFGAFEAGCIQGILASNPTRDYELYAGISVGAINAALLAQYSNFPDAVGPLANLWTGIKGHQDIWRWTVLGYAKAFCSTGIYNTDPLRKTIEDNLDIERLNGSGKCLTLGTTNVLNGQYKEVKKPRNQPIPPDMKKHLVNWLMASSAFPGAFPAIQIEDQLYSDGGLSNAAPITSTVAAGYQQIDVLLTGPKDNITSTTIDKVNNVFELLPRILVTLFLSVWIQDLQAAFLLNQTREEHGEAPAEIMVYAPPQPFSYDPLGFEPKDIAAMMTLGQQTQPVPLAQFLFPT